MARKPTTDPTPPPKRPKKPSPTTAKAKVKPKAQAVQLRALEPREQRFVEEFIVDCNATQAAIRAGYSERTARQQASRLLSKVNIQAALSEARHAQQQRTQVTADAVVMDAWNTLAADARELVAVRVGCCRHCYGHGHRWQRTTHEFNTDYERWIEAGNPPEDFDEKGGIGYRALLPPNAECPECAGAGAPSLIIKDTSTYSPSAAALYAGAKMGKYGLEILTHSKDSARELLAKHLGLYEKDNQQKTDPLAALLYSIAQSNGNGFSPVARDPEAPPERAGKGSLGAVQDDDFDEAD